MATMIPARYDESTRSAAERRLFDRLARDPDTEGWVVLHSLGLSRRADQPYGEIDFVVLVPGSGVLCLEVKGGRVQCEDGVWTVTDRYGETHRMHRSPFLQAREGMFALREALLDEFGRGHQLNRVPIGYAVLFPDVEAPPATPEVDPSEVAGRSDLQAPISRVIGGVLRGLQRRLGDRASPRVLTSGLVREVRQFLRPDFETVVARSTRIARVEEKLLRLQAEQFDVLDRIQENPRCLVRGAAGTGKTVLAVEHARRAALGGDRVLLVCFNRMLGIWLEEQFAGVEGVVAGSFHRVLRRLILASPLAGEFRAEEQRLDAGALFDRAYPLYGELVASGRFDVVVVDEAQDLVTEGVLPVLGAHLRGGLAGGRWALFGDFSRQALYAPGSVGGDDSLLDEYVPYYTRERLTTNYRNTRQVGEETALLSGFEEPPFRFCRVEGMSVDYRYWTGARQERALHGLIHQLIGDGVDPCDIVVLSPVVYERSVASRVTGDGYRIANVRAGGERSMADTDIAFCTVQSFKGLESPVVILCDIEHVDDQNPQALLYVGMSRARSHLSVLLHERNRPAVTRLTARRLLSGWGDATS